MTHILGKITMFRSLVFFLALCLVSAACSDDNGAGNSDTALQEPSTAQQLIPLKVGNSWTYRVYGFFVEGDSLEYVEQTDEITSKGVFQAETEVFSDGVWSKRPYGDVWYYGLNVHGLSGYAAVDTAIFQSHKLHDPDPVCIHRTLPNAPQPGFTEATSIRTYTWLPERRDISTPAGIFRNCWVLKWVEFDRTYEIWAPGVGMVYMFDSLADGTIDVKKELADYRIQ